MLAYRGLVGKERKIQGMVKKGTCIAKNFTCLLQCPLFPLPTVYVGLATVAAATWWFLYDTEGPQVTFYQLVSK